VVLYGGDRDRPEGLSLMRKEAAPVPKVAVYNDEGSRIGEIDISDSVFGCEIKPGLMHEAIVMYRAGQRQGTVSTKTRSEVRGGGRKPWRQKGTGRARHGSIRSPLWKGGGTIFGPKDRDYGYKMPKKARREALRSALSAKVHDGELIVLDDLQFDKPKTKRMVAILESLNAMDKPLVVTGRNDPNVWLSVRNIPGAKAVEAESLNVLDVLGHSPVIMTRQAVGKTEGVLG